MIGTPPEIRPAHRPDLVPLVKLESLAFTGLHAADRFGEEDFARYLERPGAVFLVADSGRGCIGYVLGTASQRRFRIARLDSIAVHPGARRQGAGRALAEAFARAARAQGSATVFLEVAEANTPSLELFRALGYCKTRRVPDYYAPGAHALRLRLSL